MIVLNGKEVVLGIGSYTYQYNTRDTFGFAFKSTAVIVNGKEKMKDVTLADVRRRVSMEITA